MKSLFFSTFFAVAATLLSPVSASTVVVSPSSDFFTSAWAFGAPYVLDAGRDQLGISTSSPFGMGSAPDYAWEETTYLKFDLASLGLISPVTSAILTFDTVSRSGIPADGLGVVISAHYLLSDPGSIDPMVAGSYVSFKNTQIAGIVDSVSTTAFGTYSLDLTALVNEWIVNGNSNYAFATALTGRAGNEENPDGWVAIVNSGYSGAPSLTITTVPEAASSLLMGASVFLLAHKRRRH